MQLIIVIVHVKAESDGYSLHWCVSTDAFLLKVY